MAYVKADELKKQLLRVYFRGEAAPAGFYIGLGRGPLPSSAATLAQINEVAGPGYARKALGRNTADWGAPTVALGVAKIASILKNYAATGAWDQADFIFLATTLDNTGLFLGAATFEDSFRLLNTGEDVDAGVDVEDA